MKNFFNDFITQVVSLLAMLSGIVALASGVAVILKNSDFGLVFICSVVIFAVSLPLAVKRNGGWASFLASLIPW